MNEDNIKALHSIIQDTWGTEEAGDYSAFKSSLQDEENVKSLHSLIKDTWGEQESGDYNAFKQSLFGGGDIAVPDNKTTSQPTQEPPSYQPQSQTPLDLLANRPTPFIDKKGKSYNKLEDALGKAEKHVENEQDNIFEYVGKKIGGTIKNTFKYGPVNSMAWFNAEVERSVKEDIRVNAAENKRKEIVKSINPKDVEPASYKDLYDNFLEETGDEETAVRKANIAIKTHTRRINEIYDTTYGKLKGKEKQVADDLLKGILPEKFDSPPSQDLVNWAELSDKSEAQGKELSVHTDQYKDALTGILNVIGEAKNNGASRDELETEVQNYLNSLPYDSDLRTKATELYKSSVKDGEWTSTGLADAIITNTMLKGAKSIEAVLDFTKWLGKGLSRAMQGMDEVNPINDKGLSELEKEQAFKSSNRAITQALIDPSSKYTGSISEQVVDKNGRRLVVKDGQVIDIRRPDGTKIFKPTEADIKVAESYDPEKDKPREDYRGSSILYQGAQVVSDMVPMILIGAATGGTGAAAGAAGTTSSTTLGQVAGSTLISLGDYYQEGLEQTGSVGQAMLYAGTTAPLIGYVESKIGNIEAKLGRAITQVERKSLFEALKAEGQAVAKMGIAEYVTGPGGMARLTKVIRKVGELGNDVKGELFDEITNFPVEFAGKMVAGMDPGPAPKEELEATMILTPLVTMGLGGAKIMFDNQRDIDELVGYAALNKEHFETLGSQWVNSARTETEKAKRSKDFEAKKSAVNEVHDTFNYIDENNFTPKQTDALVELSFEKARALYRLQTSNSDKTKADLNKKIAALDEKMATIMNSETRAAETYLADEEGVEEPDLITRPKEESDLGKDVIEPEIEEPAPGLGPEFDNFLATEGVKVETEVSLGDVEARMTNAEYIDVKELDAKADKLYQVWDRVDQDPRLTAETKEELKSKLENVITKLETYELATTDEVSTTTEGGAAKGVRIVGTKKIGKPSKFEVTPERIAKQGPTRVTDKDGNEFGGVFNYKDGKLSVNTKNGTIPIDQNTLEFKQSVMENGTVVGAEVYDPSTGHTFTIGNRELALDMALKAKEMEFGMAEEPLFEEVFSEVTSKTTTTKRLVREQPNTTPTTTITVEAPKIEVTTDTSQQSNKVEPDNTTTKADIERRKQALRDLMKATGDDIFMLGVEDGTFMGEALLNMNENGDVILTRYADSEEGLTKGKGKTKNLKDIAGQFGGEQIATSGIEGGAASFVNGVVGEYHIPLQELIDLIKSEDVVFAGLGNKEFVLSPHIADKYLTKINGKQINAKYDAELSLLENKNESKVLGEDKSELVNLTTTQNDIKNETSKSGGNTTSTTSNSTEDVLAKQEDELETVLEPLGKTQKEREGQIEKFFTSKDSSVDKDTAKEQAKLTARVWQSVAKFFGKRNRQTADEYITSKLKLIGQTPTSKVGETAKMQGELEITPQMADQLSANLLTHLDTMIEERTNPSKVAKALKENRGLTKASIKDQVERLKEVKARLLEAGRVSYQMDDIWHGSPHDVDKFSTSKIGTGEGVQAFGWGLYFTNLKAIAKHYAESLTPGRKYSFDGVKDLDNVATHPMTKIFLREMLKSNPANREDAIKWVEKNSNGKSEKVVSELAKFASILLVDNSVNRNLYKITLHKDKSPGQYTWLEWDKSVSDKTLESLGVRNQKLNERDYYISLLSSKDLSLLGDINQYSTKEIKETTYSKNDFKSYKEYVKEFEQDKSNRFYTGEGLYQKLSKELGSDKAASLFLLENGIDGIKYPAESIARGTTSDNAKGFNYVVFDENAVTIEEKIKFQNPGVNRGALIEYAKNEMIMVALESPNVSTAIHELYHVFQGDLAPDEVQTILDSYNETFGTNHTISDLNGKVATDVEEWGARLWEKYFANGRKLTEKDVPSAKTRSAFQNIFDKFTEWMKGVYNGVISYTNSEGATRDVNMSKPVQEMFDKIIGITPMDGGKKSTTKSAEDLSFLRDMEDFDFENLNTACVRL